MKLYSWERHRRRPQPVDLIWTFQIPVVLWSESGRCLQTRPKQRKASPVSHLDIMALLAKGDGRCEPAYATSRDQHPQCIYRRAHRHRITKAEIWRYS